VQLTSSQTSGPTHRSLRQSAQRPRPTFLTLLKSDFHKSKVHPQWTLSEESCHDSEIRVLFYEPPGLPLLCASVVNSHHVFYCHFDNQSTDFSTAPQLVLAHSPGGGVHRTSQLAEESKSADLR